MINTVAVSDPESSNISSSSAKAKGPVFDFQIDVEGLLSMQCSENTTHSTNKSVKAFDKFFKRFEVIEKYPALETLPPGHLDYLLTNFLATMKKANGDPYEPSTINSHWFAIRRHLLDKGYAHDISSDKEFIKSRKAKVAVLKRIKRDGGGNLPKRASCVTTTEFNSLFDKNVIGDHNPLALVNGIFAIAMLFGTRGQSEVYNRTLGDFMIVTENGKKYLTLVRERVSKMSNGTNPRDLRRGMPKLMSRQDSRKCPVALFEAYVSRRPDGYKGANTPLLLNPLTTNPCLDWTNNQGAWYKRCRMGVNQIGKVVKKMFSDGGVETNGRNISNTSLRKMLATSLLTAKMAPGSIVAMTGHRNVGSLVHYDTLNEQRSNQITDILLPETRPCPDNISAENSSLAVTSSCNPTSDGGTGGKTMFGNGCVVQITNFYNGPGVEQ